MSDDSNPRLTVLTPEAPDGPEPPEPTPEQRAQLVIDAWVQTLSEVVRTELSHNDLDALQRNIVALSLDPKAKAIAAQRWTCLESPFVLSDEL